MLLDVSFFFSHYLRGEVSINLHYFFIPLECKVISLLLVGWLFLTRFLLSRTIRESLVYDEKTFFYRPVLRFFMQIKNCL